MTNPWAALVPTVGSVVGTAPAVTDVALPTLEPYKAALLGYLQGSWVEAAEIVNGRYFNDESLLDTPKAWMLVSTDRIEVIQQWPTLVLHGYNLRTEDMTDQGLAITWRGTIELVVWYQNSDMQALQKILDRTGELLYLLILNFDQQRVYPRAELDWDGYVSDQGAPEGGSANVRGVGVAYEVVIRP